LVLSLDPLRSALIRSPARLEIALAVLVAAGAGCRRIHHHETAATAEAAVLDRRRQGLAALVAAARRGPLLPFDKVLVVANERLVRDVVAASLPFERVIGDRYRVRVTGAEVHFEDGFGLVRLDGDASFADRPAEDARADLTAYGDLDVVGLDPRSGMLRGEVKVIAVDARKVDVMGVRASVVENLVEDLGREKLEAFSALASHIEIPVRLEQAVTLPAVGPGEVRIDAATVPLKVSVADVKAFRGRLWVCVDVSAAPTPPAPAPSPAGSAPR
jgi:hypothetical protein